jgi:hypothetical protein
MVNNEANYGCIEIFRLEWIEKQAKDHTVAYITCPAQFAKKNIYSVLVDHGSPVTSSCFFDEQ